MIKEKQLEKMGKSWCGVIQQNYPSNESEGFGLCLFSGLVSVQSLSSQNRKNASFFFFFYRDQKSHFSGMLFTYVI